MARGAEAQGGDETGSGTPHAGAPADPAEVAAVLAGRLAQGSLIYVAHGEPRAEAIARDLAVAAPGTRVLFCPGSDALPGDAAPPSPANAGQRVAALHAIRAALRTDAPPAIALITTGEACARLYPPPAAFDAAPPAVRLGEPVDLEALAAELSDAGYLSDERVDEPGEIALRGQVLDIFPADAEEPVRVEAQDGRVAVLHRFDPATQLSTGSLEALEAGRASEPPLGKGAILPEHLAHAAVLVEPAADDRRQRFLELAADAARDAKRRAKDLASEKRWQDGVVGRLEAAPVSGEDAPPRFVEGEAPLETFARFAADALEAGDRLVLLGHRRDLRFLARRVGEALGTSLAPAESWATVAEAKAGSAWSLAVPAERGFRSGKVVAVAAADLLGSRALRGDAAHAAAASRLFDLGDIAVGDVVVHEDHGLGVVDALEALPDDVGGDAIAIRYADDGRRLVPVADADRLWRYGADEGAVALDRLDGASWHKRRGAIDAAVAESARALTALAAAREGQVAPVFDPPAGDYERFVSGFPYPETPDQARAIAAVRHDLASGRPMDRLVVGDVGYGKTEVAMRAAALAALAGWQVAVAAPTTVLARQHLEQFAARFAGLGIAVAGLSRLSSAAEKRAVKAGLADGSIRVVIGTAAVAGKGVAYEKLGLVIVDEEQRFGAKDKERLRSLSAGHLLTLSATPIPRTLQGALVGLRQMSVIATPPARRRPIRTMVGAFVPERLRTALLREQSRGGQSFVVVPRIEDMAPLAEQLARLVPELEVVAAHGKLPAAELDEVMVGFAGGRGDVLLATNIVEAGLDVPRANTMAIWRADRFGLSQLHQLRGRVGRGSRRGQVMLLTDPDATIAPRTLKRLRTLEAFDRLGAGFEISARDLDMRGAGDLLGEAQAGHMKLIGIDLYQHLLGSALRAARGEDVDRWTPELNLGLSGRLPADWIHQDEVRVTLYTRLARLEDSHALDAFEAELEDRFGALPAEAETLLAVTRARLHARTARIARVDAGPSAIAFTPRPDFSGDAAAAGLHDSKGRLLLSKAIEDARERLARVEAVLATLAGRKARRLQPRSG